MGTGDGRPSDKTSGPACKRNIVHSGWDASCKQVESRAMNLSKLVHSVKLAVAQAPFTSYPTSCLYTTRGPMLQWFARLTGLANIWDLASASCCHGQAWKTFMPPHSLEVLDLLLAFASSRSLLEALPLSLPHLLDFLAFFSLFSSALQSGWPPSQVMHTWRLPFLHGVDLQRSV